MAVFGLVYGFYQSSGCLGLGCISGAPAANASMAGFDPLGIGGACVVV